MNHTSAPCPDKMMISHFWSYLGQMWMDFAQVWLILKPGATETEIMPKHFGRKPYGRNNGRYYGRKAYGRTLRAREVVSALLGGRVKEGELGFGASAG